MEHTARIYLRTVIRMVDQSENFNHIPRDRRDAIVASLTEIVNDLWPESKAPAIDNLRDMF